MKVELELPDWVDERHIFIVAGIEMVAYNLYGERKWYIKTGKCNMCGKCCNMPNGKYFPYPRTKDGDCVHLKKSVRGDYGECSLGTRRPWECCTDLTQRKNDRPYCTVEYEAVA